MFAWRAGAAYMPQGSYLRRDARAAPRSTGGGDHWWRGAGPLLDGEPDPLAAPDNSRPARPTERQLRREGPGRAREAGAGRRAAPSIGRGGESVPLPGCGRSRWRASARPRGETARALEERTSASKSPRRPRKGPRALARLPKKPSPSRERASPPGRSLEESTAASWNATERCGSHIGCPVGTPFTWVATSLSSLRQGIT